MIQRISLKRERYAEILAKRPVPPWVNEIPEGDFISPYPTYKNGQCLDRFEKKSFSISFKKELKYYVFDPTLHGFSKDGVYPVLTFFHGTNNSFVGDLCINFTGAELFASDDYQASMGGAYIIVPIANEYRNAAWHIKTFLLKVQRRFSLTKKIPEPVKNLIVRILNKIINNRRLRGRTKGTWSQKYAKPVHSLLSEVIAGFGKSAGPVFLLGNSVGGAFLLKLMETYPDAYDAAVPCGNLCFGDGTVLDKIDEKNKYLFFAHAKRDELHGYKEYAPWLDRLQKMKHCFLYTPEWVRNGDKGIASIETIPEQGQHCLINSIQANLMFDDGTPMDERLPDGMTGWIKQVTQEIINRK